VKRERFGVQTKLARFTSHVVTLAQKAVVGSPEPAVQKGQGGYADWLIVSMHSLREYLNQPYRRLLDILHEMPNIVDILGLDLGELPDFTTLCKRKQELKMPLWRDFLRLSAELHDTGEVQAIDATGLDRIAPSNRYAEKTDYTFRAVKTTALVDCETSAILDIHCDMRKRGDTEAGWQVLKRNIEKLSAVVADKGYDWNLIRYRLHVEGVETEIKHREFDPMSATKNTILDDTTYHQRSNVESVFFALRQRFGQQLRARTWFGQFREVVLKAAVRNVILPLSDSNA
jgi:IS5 family transposase